MLSPSELEDAATSVDPQALGAELSRQGWHLLGERAGLYSRWSRELVGDEHNASLIVPLNKQMSDYVELMQDALSAYARHSSVTEREARALIARLKDEVADLLRWRRETPSRDGAISWPTGRRMYDAAEQSLLSAAKARLSRSPYYGNRNGRFAHRFLEACLMGQTEVGSYVVTAHAPVRARFTERESARPAPQGSAVPLYTGREITELLVGALRSTQEAVEHYDRFRSLSGFDEAVKVGVSKELTQAIYTMILDKKDAEFSVDWSPSQAPHLQDLDPIDEGTTTLIFDGGAAEVLEEAVNHLASREPVEYVTVVGWVNVVSRPRRGEAGVVRLKVLKGSQASTLRVRLSNYQFDLAAQAISDDRAIRVSGKQERLRSSYWLSDVTQVEPVSLDDERVANAGSPLP